MLLSPMAAAGIAHPTGFKGVSWVPNSSLSSDGCGKVKETQPRLTASTGDGRWAGTATASTCSKVLGGIGQDSSASTYGGLTVYVPVKLSGSTGGVNVSWSLLVALAVKASVISASSCPFSYSYNYSYYYSYYPSWVNTTEYSGYCSADASASISGDAYILDTTTGTIYDPSNYWNGAGINYDRYNDSSYSVTNYSNPSFYRDNYSYSNSYGYQSGGTGSMTLTPASSPTWYINGTFTKSDKYVVVAEIDASVSASIDGLKKSTTSAMLNAAGPSNYEDLQVTVW
jgi:hypothetical protein